MVVLEKHSVVIDHGVSRPEGEIVISHFAFQVGTSALGTVERGIAEYSSWSQGRDPAGGIFSEENCSPETGVSGAELQHKFNLVYCAKVKAVSFKLLWLENTPTGVKDL